MYEPNNWVILKITKENQEPYYKVLAGWYGGYLYGDSWKLNSGITKVDQDDDFYYFHGYSGSTYKCPKEQERFSGITAGIYADLKEVRGGTIEHVPVEELLGR